MTLRNLVPWNWNKDHFPEEKGLDNFFDNFLGNFNIAPVGFSLGNIEKELAYFNPKIDIKEGKKDIKISAELPGLDEKDIDVSLKENILTIKGEKKREHEDKKDGYYHMERSYGSFSRAIHLADEIDQEKIKATYKKGVLRLTLPKTGKVIEDQRKIKVKAA